MSRGPDALGSDTSLGLRAEVPPDPRFLNEGKQEEDKRGTGGPPEGDPCSGSYDQTPTLCLTSRTDPWQDFIIKAAYKREMKTATNKGLCSAQETRLKHPAVGCTGKYF